MRRKIRERKRKRRRKRYRREEGSGVGRRIRDGKKDQGGGGDKGR